MILALAIVAAFALLVIFGAKCRARSSFENTGRHPDETSDADTSARRGAAGAKSKPPDGPKLVLAAGVAALLGCAAFMAYLPLKGHF